MKKLKADGWVVLRVKGSHHFIQKGNQFETIPIHAKKDIPKGLAEKIMKKTGLK